MLRDKPINTKRLIFESSFRIFPLFVISGSSTQSVKVSDKSFIQPANLWIPAGYFLGFWLFSFIYRIFETSRFILIGVPANPKGSRLKSMAGSPRRWVTTRTWNLKQTRPDLCRVHQLKFNFNFDAKMTYLSRLLNDLIND